MCRVMNIRRDGWPVGNEGVYVGRSRAPGDKHHFGNPFSHDPFGYCIMVGSREEAVEAYRAWLRGMWPSVEPERRRWILDQLRAGHLTGRDLYCWCAPKACHADVLLEMANGEMEVTHAQ